MSNTITIKDVKHYYKFLNDNNARIVLRRLNSREFRYLSEQQKINVFAAFDGAMGHHMRTSPGLIAELGQPSLYFDWSFLKGGTTLTGLSAVAALWLDKLIVRIIAIMGIPLGVILAIGGTGTREIQRVDVANMARALYEGLESGVLTDPYVNIQEQYNKATATTNYLNCLSQSKTSSSLTEDQKTANYDAKLLKKLLEEGGTIVMPIKPKSFVKGILPQECERQLLQNK